MYGSTPADGGLGAQILPALGAELGRLTGYDGDDRRRVGSHSNVSAPCGDVDPCCRLCRRSSPCRSDARAPAPALAEDQEAAIVLTTSSVDLGRLAADVSDYLSRTELPPPEVAGPRISNDLRRILEAAAAAPNRAAAAKSTAPSCSQPSSATAKAQQPTCCEPRASRSKKRSRRFNASFRLRARRTSWRTPANGSSRARSHRRSPNRRRREKPSASSRVHHHPAR